MPKKADEFTVFTKIVNGKPSFYVYYRDQNGNRMAPISLNKLKREICVGKERLIPVENKIEAIKIASKASVCKKTYELIYNRKKPASPNFIEFVKMINTYETSPYIKLRIKDNNPIKEHTMTGYLSAFTTHVEKVINKKLTLADIENSNGAELTKIRDKVINLDICSTTKNKGLQAMRTALEYASARSYIKFSYKDRLKNTKIEANGTNCFSVKEINKIIKYYENNTEKGTYERSKYLTIALAATTGLRPGEIEALKKSEIYKIDKKNDCAILKITNAIDIDKTLSTRKNHDITYVATYIPLINEILDFSKSNPKKQNYCFWDKTHPEKQISADYFKGTPYECFCKIGLKPQDRKLSFYSLRKTASTIIAISKQMGAEKAAELLGHKDINVTLKHYIFDTPESAIANFNDIRQLIKLPA